MRSFVTLGVLSLLGAAALVACGDDDPGTGTAGTGGSGGSGGARAGAGGMAGSGTAGTPTGGMGGGGGAGGAPAASTCVGAAEGGCAEIFIPTASTGSVDFEIDLGATTPVDMSNSTMTVRLKALAGSTGNIQLYVKNGMPQGFAGYYTAFTALTTDFQNVVLSLTPCPVPGGGGADAGAVDAGDGGAAAPCGAATFDKRAVRFVGLQVLAPTAATSVQIDSIKFTPNPPADFTFATAVQGLTPNMFSTPTPPAGTTVTFAAAP